jgi:2-phosphosulfolactate phosphatase
VSTLRRIEVHLLPQLAAAERLRGGIAVVIDVLRATTTVIHALASGCTAVYPVVDVEEARRMVEDNRDRKFLLAGERQGKPLPGFDLGNSPLEHAPLVCQGATLVLTTTNGTLAMHRAAAAERVLIGAFVNFSAVCEQLLRDTRPIHIVCAGTDGEITLEDTLLAGAFVEALCQGVCQPPPKRGKKTAPAFTRFSLNDGARLAWDCFEQHGMVIEESLRLSKGGENLLELGYGKDITAAAQIDRFMLVPEVRRDPIRIEIGALGMVRRRWPMPHASED